MISEKIVGGIIISFLEDNAQKFLLDPTIRMNKP